MFVVAEQTSYCNVIGSKQGPEMFNYDICSDRLPSAWNSWTPEGPMSLLDSCSEFIRIE